MIKSPRKQQQPARRSGYPSVRQTRVTQSELNERYSFRRNRTLTGSLSPGVSSAGEYRAELKSSRVHAHDLRHHRKRLSLVLFAVLLAGAALVMLIYQSVASVHVISSTDRPIESAIYQQKIQDYLSTRPLERSRLTLDTTRLGQYLQTTGYPEIKSISPDTEFAGLGVSKLSITFRRPAVVWSTGSSRLYVDETGVAFMRNYFAEPNVNVVDQSGIETKNNRVLASNRFLSFIGTVIGRLQAQGYTVTQVSLPVGTTRQIAVSVSAVPYPIKLSVDRPVGEQTEDAIRAMEYLSRKGITPEYIDVRVSGKVYYK